MRPDLCMGCQESPSEEGLGMMKAAEQPWGDGEMVDEKKRGVSGLY